LAEDIYMKFPPGYVPATSGTGLKLIRSLYGLKQSPRVWWKLISSYLATIGFTRLEADWGLYYRKTDNTYLLLYVDDVLIASRTGKAIDSVREALTAQWKWSDIGEAGYILGLKIDRHRPARTLRLSQSAYLERMLEKFGMQHARPVSTPLEDARLHKQDDSIPVDNARRSLYQSIVGSLMWCAMSARPDMAFTVGYLSRFNSNPSEQHLQAAKRALAYIRKTTELVLTLGGTGSGKGRLIGYCDSDYAGDLETRRSTTGFVFKYRNSVIAWGSTRQATVATSTCEAEYMALTEAVKEAIWLRRILTELDKDYCGATQLYCDNQGALALADNPGKHKRTKHIDIRYHYVRETVDNGLIMLQHIGTNDQAADMLTKALKTVKHDQNCALVRLEH
jgi:hypothetical protein